MALSNEDKKDVARSFGKATANKVEKATHDTFKAPGHKRRLTHRTITDDAGGRTVQFGGKANYHRSAKSQALAKKGGGLRYKPAPMPKNYTSMSHEDRSNYYKKNKGTMVSDEVNPKTGKYYNTY